MARVLLTREARRHYEELSPRLQEPVLTALTDLEVDPESAGKALLGRLRGLWSARVGSYRILYTIEGSRVVIRAIRHRAVAYGTRRRRR